MANQFLSNSSPPRLSLLRSLLSQIALNSSLAFDPPLPRAISFPSSATTLALFCLLPLSNCPSWLLSFLALLCLLLAFTDYHEAPLGAPALNLLAAALCHTCRPDLALLVFTDFGTHCYYLDRDTYRALMRS